jgi:hypothetical protein
LAEGFSSVGTFLLRNIYHYWYHLGEGMAVRQMLGHKDLADFVGDIDSQAPYRTEPAQPGERPLQKGQLISLVRGAWRSWDSLLSKIDDQKTLRPGASGDWSVKDIVAHLAWHEREMIGVLRARALVGSDLWEQPLDQRNRAIYETYRSFPLDRVRADAREARDLLLAELAKLDEEDLYDSGRFAGMPSEWRPLDLLAENTYLHYLDHISSLEEWLGEA